MKIGMITDSLPDADFDTMLAVAARLEMDMLEFGCGNWSTAPHIELDRMLESAPARREFRARLDAHGIGISALNCSGNPVHPGEAGRRHDEVTRKTIRLAGLLGVDRVVMMSGCPGAPGDSHANWITTEWPPEVREVLRWQWDDVLIPYWRDLVAYAREQGVHRLCLELHGYQNVYSVATLKRLRDAVGETVGANLDPSHLMWMGADPLAAAVRWATPSITSTRRTRASIPSTPASTASSTRRPAAISRRARGATSRSGSATTRSGGASSSRRSRRPATTACCRSSTRIRR